MIKKLLKKLLVGLIALIVLINLFILLTGRKYIYRGLTRTYFVGKMAPGISDRYDFEHREVKGASQVFNWKKHPSYNKKNPSQEQLNKLKKYETVSFLVAKKGKLIHEQYFDGYTQDSLTNSFSVVKTLIGQLIGIAIEEGKIESVDQKVSDFIPSFNEGGKEKITIKHLLTMSSGLDWIESGKNPLSHNAEAYYTTDLRSLIDNLEVEKEPGKYFEYKSGNTQILAFILEKVTDKNVSEYATEKVWSKIGANEAWWMLDNKDGFEKAYCCFYASAKDNLKLGQLYLNKGRWQGKQILSKKYLEASIQPADLLVGDKPNKIYGYQWWLENYKGYQINYARGLLGQYIIIIPELDLVIYRAGHKRGKKTLIGHPVDFYTIVDAALEVST